MVGESKQFFKAYSQKGSKISMSSFLCKLREVLVYLKEDRSFTFHTHPSNGEEEQLEFKNS